MRASRCEVGCPSLFAQSIACASSLKHNVRGRNIVVVASIDYETYSEAGFVATPEGWDCPRGAKKKGLPVVGSSVYVEHPTFEILTMSYNLGSGKRRWKPGNLPPVDLFAHIRKGGLVSGWNSGGFEVKVWAWCVDHLRWPAVPTGQWRDSMAAARAHGLPGKLEKVAEVLGCAQQKNKDGKRLLDKFSIPRKPTTKDPRRRITPEEDPADAEQLYAYCDQDVCAEQDVASRIPELSPSELAVWQCDRAINDRGVQMDVPGIESCIEIVTQAHERYNAELPALTGGAVSRASELAKMVAWCETRGVSTVSLDEEHLEALLATELPPDVRRVLEIRAAIGSASVKKVFAMRNCISADGRIRDLFIYHGARTGRCLAAGSPVLVLNQLGEISSVPIESVTQGHKIWDGAEWVCHGGVVCNGTREVVSYDGIVATPDHIVFTSTNEYAKLSEVLETKTPIFRGELPCPTTSID